MKIRKEKLQLFRCFVVSHLFREYDALASEFRRKSFFKEKSSQVIQKSSHNLNFLKKQKS
jgi:hypothetical protein